MDDTLAKTLFWIGAATLAYAYILYPLYAWLAARRHPQSQRFSPGPRNISVLLAVRNEAANIQRRLAELTHMMAAHDACSELIIISDGSTDATATIAEQFASNNVRLVRWDQNRGKAAAVTYAASLARHEILVMADGRQRWASDALARMLENFDDPSIGAVSGELVLEERPGTLAGVGLYWKFEKWLRRQESRHYSQVGVTGAIAAVRRSLFRPIPDGMILDDVYWPMQVVLQGYRVIHDGRAIAFDSLPESTGGELRRKVRTLVGNFQLAAAMPELLAPWRNPAWLAFVSHKMLRLAAPWAMLGVLLGSALASGYIYRVVFAGQLVGLIIALTGLATPAGPKHGISAAAGSFLLLHVAAWLAFWSWITGGAGRVWRQQPIAGRRLEGVSQT
jgi:cellulose synthase/poly-beta-1,6-N-acetylglucosamine synthase-like glycosyltransferase